MACTQGIGQSALALRRPHESVHVVGPGVILNQAQHERPIGGVVAARVALAAAVKVELVKRLPRRRRRLTLGLLNQGVGLEAVLARGLHGAIHQVDVGEFRGAHVVIRQVGTLVIFHMRDAIVPAAKALLGHGHKPSLMAEGEEEQRVDAAGGAQCVQKTIRVARQRPGADLHADDRRRFARGNSCWRNRLPLRLTRQRGDAHGGGRLKCFTTRRQLTGHGTPPWLEIARMARLIVA